MVVEDVPGIICGRVSLGEITVVNGRIHMADGAVEPPDVTVVDTVFIAQEDKLALIHHHGAHLVAQWRLCNPAQGVAPVAADQQEQIGCGWHCCGGILNIFPSKLFIRPVGYKKDPVSTAGENRLQVIVNIVGQLLVCTGSNIKEVKVRLPQFHCRKNKEPSVGGIREVYNLFKIIKDKMLQFVFVKIVKIYVNFTFSFDDKCQQLAHRMPGEQRVRIINLFIQPETAPENTSLFPGRHVLEHDLVAPQFHLDPSGMAPSGAEAEPGVNTVFFYPFLEEIRPELFDGIFAFVYLPEMIQAVAYQCFEGNTDHIKETVIDAPADLRHGYDVGQCLAPVFVMDVFPQHVPGI